MPRRAKPRGQRSHQRQRECVNRILMCIRYLRTHDAVAAAITKCVEAEKFHRQHLDHQADHKETPMNDTLFIPSPREKPEELRSHLWFGC